MFKSLKAAKLIGGSTGLVVLGLGGIGFSAITGNLNTTSVSYGPVITTQTINTGFGDSTVGDGTSSGGSELDAGYGVVQNGDLYVFLAGNFEDNGNHLNVFISDGRAGQGTLALPATGTMQAMNGSVFSPGFQATYALDANDYSGTTYVEEYTYAGPVVLSGGYVGAVGLSGGIGSGTPGVATIAWNDTNISVMVAGAAANQAAADAVTTGAELAIPLSILGSPALGSSIMVLADINGGGDTYLSNQFLPGLPVGYGNLGPPPFSFGSTPGQFFTITVPEPASMAMLGGVTMLLTFRRRKA